MRGGCFRGDSPILLPEGKYRQICEVKVGDAIESISERTGQLETDVVTSIHSTIVKQYIKIHLSDSSVVECTPNHLFMCSDGVWRRYETERDEERLRVGMSLRTPTKETLEVVRVTQERLKYPEPFLHLCMKNNHNYLVGKTIVHNMQLKIKTFVGESFTINIQPSDLMIEIKQKIEEEKQIPVKQQILTFLGKRLDDDNKSLQDYDVLGQQSYPSLNLVIINDKSELTKTLVKRVVLKISNAESCVYDFDSIKDLNAKGLIKTIFEQPSAYFSLFYKEKFMHFENTFQDLEAEFSKVQ